jgi:hypothetical protein
MKHIRTLAIAACLFVMNMVSAQSAKTNWPKLNDVKEVAARINMNLEHNNPHAFSFAGTLSQQAVQLKASEAPANFKNKKTEAAVNELVSKSEALNRLALAKASDAELKQKFLEIQTILASLGDTPKAKK